MYAFLKWISCLLSVMLIFLWELWISLKLVSWLLDKMLCFDHPFADFSFSKFDGFLLSFSDCWSISMLQGLWKADCHASIRGDIIEYVNGKEVTNSNDLFKAQAPPACNQPIQGMVRLWVRDSEGMIWWWGEGKNLFLRFRLRFFWGSVLLGWLTTQKKQAELEPLGACHDG